MGYPEQYSRIEANPAPAGPALDPLCRGGNHRACIGPPGTRCDCSCHVTRPALRPSMSPLATEEPAGRCPSCGHARVIPAQIGKPGCDGIECSWCPEGYCEDIPGTLKAENDAAADLGPEA